MISYEYIYFDFENCASDQATEFSTGRLSWMFELIHAITLLYVLARGIYPQTVFLCHHQKTAGS